MRELASFATGMGRANRLSVIVRAAAVLLAVFVGVGCDALGEQDSGCEGKCDDLTASGAIICGPRAAATGELGCSVSSTTDFGLDPDAAKVISASLHVARRDVSVPLNVSIYVGEKRARTLTVPDARDGVITVKWDGKDDDGAVMTDSVFEARLEGDDLEPSSHRIYRLASLPDEGPGHEHPLGSDKVNSDDWGRVHVIDALLAVSEEWNRPVKIAYLDLSAQNGGEFRPHTYHQHGDCIDIRYVRSDGPGPLDLASSKRFYDREASQALVDALASAGAIEIYVDPLAELEGDLLVEVGGHTNHLHAMFAQEPGTEEDTRAINHGFVGGPCFDDSDCPLREGFCLRDPSSAIGTCTRECKSSCSDFVGGIYTLSECVRLERHLCMPARDVERYPETEGCRADLEATSMSSEDCGNAATDVCVP